VASTADLLSDGTSSYLYGPDSAPVEQVTSTATAWYVHDGQGSTRALLDRVQGSPKLLTRPASNPAITLRRRARGGEVLYRSVGDLVPDDQFLDLAGLVPDTRVVLKIEGLNPVGSIKLKTAVALLDDAEARGLLGPGGRIIESSSGNLGIALSSLCAARGYRFTCVVDPNTARQSVSLMRVFGARVVEVTARDSNGGFLQSRIDYIAQRVAAEPDLYWPNQYANPANARAHYERTARAIAVEVPELDRLFVGAGTTGTLMGCARYFREGPRRPRIVAVDTEGSVTFGFPAGRRRIPGLGASRRPEILDSGLVDEVVVISEREAVMMCRRVAAEYGIAVGGSTGTVLAAVARSCAGRAGGDTVVAIGADTGDRYLDTVYDDAWVRDHLGPLPLPGPRLRVRPYSLPRAAGED
jgi:N-(2-amino-2-carboxyethyl)-L-glutamate synthase